MPEHDHKLDAVTEISRRRAVVNAIASYGGHAVYLGVGLLLTAYVIRTLGTSEYALWPLIATCTALVALIPSSVGKGVGRFLAHALGRGDVKEVERITTSVFTALVVAAGVYTACVVLLSVFFERIFDIPPGTVGVGPWAMLLVGLAGAVRIPFGVFQAGLIAGQCFVAHNIIRAAFFVARAVLTVLAFTVCTPSLIWVAAIFLAVQTASAVTTYAVARRRVPWQRLRWRSFDWAVLRRVSNFSLWTLVFSVAGLLYWKTDNVVINKLLDPTWLTGYAIVAGLLLASYRVTALGSTALGPAITVMHAQDDIPRIERVIYRTNRVLVPLGAFPVIFCMVFGKPLLRAYVGAGYESYAYLFPILAVGLIACMPTSAAGYVPMAFGRIALPSLVSLTTGVANVAVSVFLVVALGWGLAGVAAGTTIVWVLYNFFFWTPLVAHLLRVRLRRYFLLGTVVPLANCIPAGATFALLRVCGLGRGWLGLLAVLAIAAAVQGAHMLLWGLARKDQEVVLGSLRAALRWARHAPRPSVAAEG